MNSLNKVRQLVPNKVWTLFAVTASALAAILVVAGPSGPVSPDRVVHSADPLTPVFKRESQLAQLPAFIAARQQSTKQPNSAEQASASAKLALQMYQSTGNTRFLGAAKSSIAPWQNIAQPPAAIWLLRGRILQTEHHFAEAAQDLSHYNREHAASTEALLLEADAWRRAGEINRSRRTCFELAIQGRTDLATYCSAEILLSVGQAETAKTLVEPVIDYTASLPAAQKNWAMAIYADLLSATGETEKAAAVWATVIAGDGTALTYKLAYADVLLALARYRAVADLLSEHASTTAALLRLTVAATRLQQDDAAMLKSVLEQRLTRVKLTSEPDLHLREEALFALWLEDDAPASLRLALRNWELQKGWEDAALVIHVAELLQNVDTVNRIRTWQQLHATKGST